MTGRKESARLGRWDFDSSAAHTRGHLLKLGAPKDPAGDPNRATGGVFLSISCGGSTRVATTRSSLTRDLKLQARAQQTCVVSLS
jgi:hypothetical protein